MKNEIVEGLNTFYASHVIETKEQTLQIFRSFTYGEMVIAYLLLLILLVMIFKWVWEVLAW